MKNTLNYRTIAEYVVIKRLITEVYPNGIVSLVGDSFNLWEVLVEILPRLKNKILARDGKLVIRPDSGDPVDILCGKIHKNGGMIYYTTDGKDTMSTNRSENILPYEDLPENKGVIELLWDTFGGTINEKGYKVLDPHIGAIYGDSITLSRAQQICQRLMEKGFCSTNVVFGIGSYTYQYNTRDTFGFAMKATWCQVSGVAHNIFKDPITDDGTKKSAKGLVRVDLVNGEYVLTDQCTPEQEAGGCLETIFENGKMVKLTTLREIRDRVKSSL